MDEACHQVAMLEDCGPLLQVSALIDLIAIAVLLLLLVFDRCTRPALAAAFTRATQPGSKTATAASRPLLKKRSSSFFGQEREALRRKQVKRQTSSASSDAEKGNGVAAKASSGGGDDQVIPKVGVERYSVWVTNPPPDLVNPDEWKEYFEKNFGEVREQTMANHYHHNPSCCSFLATPH
jgi:hypothetical protein